ncbi:MAG TPA: hypothetical protein VFV52_06730 [Bacilli bacterium]|nr:hypothetical protein [Bacilli bacterium]
MSEKQQFYARYKVEEGFQMQARFDDINDRDGFEISLGMYRPNLGPVTEEVFRRYAQRFNGVVMEPEPHE